MKASILPPDCQNLVIRNKSGKIVAKSTLYVNRAQGYGVFNNVEINSFVDSSERKLIYQKYIKAINDFVERYNVLNNDRPITQINVGMGLNDLYSFIKQHNIQSSKILKCVDFSLFGRGAQSYAGDWQKEQYVLWKK